MGAIMNKVKGLFKTSKSLPTLSPFTVQHEKLDEFILSDMIDHSKRFEATVTEPVMIQRDDGTTTAYEQAPDLRKDLFFAHHVGTDEVTMKERSDVRPSSQLNGEIMQAFTNHPDFQKIRPMTRLDPVAATLSTMAAQQTLESELQTTLKDQAQEANDLGATEADLEEAMKRLEEYRQQAKDLMAQGLGIPDELKQLIKNAVKDKHAAGDKLDNATPGFGGVGGHIQNAVNRAVKDAKELAEVYVSLPGVGVGAGQRIQPEHAIELAYKWRDAPNLKKMADLIGRFERDFRYKRSHRVVGGMDEIVGVEVGRDVKRLLPFEFANLMHPLLKKKFYKDFVNEQLLQYEMIGHAESGKGPVIICIDASGSMGGDRNEWARATALAVTSICHREKRAVYIIEFAGAVTGEWEFQPKGGIDPEIATDFAMSFNGGGTDITSALHRAKKIFDTHPSFKTADVIVITDGSDYCQEDDMELKAYFNGRGVRLMGVVIGMENTPYTDTVCDEAVSVYDLAAPSGATDRIVQGLT